MSKNMNKFKRQIGRLNYTEAKTFDEAWYNYTFKKVRKKKIILGFEDAETGKEITHV